MTTPIGDAAAKATAFRSRRSRTGPQAALPAPVPAAQPLRNLPETATAQEETVSPVTAALAAVQHQAAAIEADVAANPLAVVIAARHVGRDFTSAECIAIADFVAAIEAERRAQADSRSRAAAAVAASANGSGSRATGPQPVMP